MTSSIWITVGPIIGLNIVFLTTLFVFLAKRRKIPAVKELDNRFQSRILGRTLQEYWYWVTKPVARFFVKLRLSPNILTFIGFSINCVAAYFFAVGYFGYAGWLMIFGSTFDLFDGYVARLTGKQSRSGAYFDSVMDRFSESVVLIGLAIFYRGTWMLPVIMIGLVGSMMVSYTRARGEGTGVVCKKGPMQRPERAAYLTVAAVFQPIADSVMHIWFAQPPAILVMTALCLIAALTIYTAFYRIVFIMDALDSADRARDEEATLPQLLTRMSTRAGREEIATKARYGYARGQARYTSSLVFVADGAQRETFEQLLRKGDLPHIARHLIEPGSYNTATSVFPSTAGPASTPIVTGCFPGTCNIPGRRWFDRSVPPQKRFTLKRFRDYTGWGSYAIDFDLSKEVKTIFEYSRQAVNLLGMINRGSGIRRDPAFLRSPQWAHDATDPAQVKAAERAVFEWFCHSLRRQPDFIFYYYPTIDRLVRSVGPDDPQVIEAYKRFDHYVGDAVEHLKTHGLYDQTALVLLSDHGHAPREWNFDLDAFLDTYFQKAIHATSPSYRGWLESEAINLVSGNAMANLYFRKERSWSTPRSLEEMRQQSIVNALLEQPGVDLVMGRSAAGGVTVTSRRGTAHIIENGAIRYEVEGDDPFGYTAVPSKLSRREALQLTAETPYPDGIVQAAQLFRSARAGDLVVSALPGWAFGDEREAAQSPTTTGSLARAHIAVPCASSVDLAPGPIRTADLFPTILQCVGLVPDQPIDGQVLI